jgi:hypothetical protein
VSQRHALGLTRRESARFRIGLAIGRAGHLLRSRRLIDFAWDFGLAAFDRQAAERSRSTSG